MTERERWTVYPLLFLALGLALKDKLSGQVNLKDVRCKTMVCNALHVEDPQGKERVKVTSGNVTASGNVQSKNVVCGALLVPSAQGKELVAISANADGGFVRTVGSQNGVTTFLGNIKQVAGLMFVDPQGVIHGQQLFAAPKPAEEKPAEEKPADGAPPEKAPQDAPAESEAKPPGESPTADTEAPGARP